MKFSPDGRALYVLDMGPTDRVPQGVRPRPGTGVLWRIARLRHAGDPLPPINFVAHERAHGPGTPPKFSHAAEPNAGRP